jgi:hypothetical protein
LRTPELAAVAKLLAFHQFVRPVSRRSIIPWSDCSAPGLSTLKLPGA